MKPELFGRGAWLFIFKLFFYYSKKIIEQNELVNLIRQEEEFNKKLEHVRYVFFKDNILFSYNYLKNGNLKTIKNNIEQYNTEHLKNKLSKIINSLPCEECKTHATEHIHINHVYNSDSFFYIFHFFLELRNRFYKNTIDRNLFETYDDFTKNEGFFFLSLIDATVS